MKIENEIKQTSFKNEYHKLALNIMVTNNWLSERAVEFLKPFDITPKQYNVLRILRGQQPQPITVFEIRNRMIDKMSDVSRIVERLLKKGLVDRNICKDNRRAVDVVITGKGLDLVAELDNIDDKMRDNLLSISAGEAKKVNEILDKIRT